MEFAGQVVLKRVGRGSKSDRKAVCLEMEGETYVLRRVGGHPFQDPVLDELVGARIQGSGHLSGRTILMREWSRADDA